MSVPRRFNTLHRKVGTKQPKTKIVIFSEGEKTEQDYFEAMKRRFRSVVLDVEIIGGAGVPLTIADKAIQAAKQTRRRNKRQSYAQHDEFWVAFDCDEHPNVRKAISLCGDARIRVAFSNPCFELWLILHFEDFDRSCDHHDVQRHLETLCRDYDREKHKTTDCDNLMQHVERAERAAERQVQRRKEEGDPPGPPFTTVYELTRRIRGQSP